MCDDQMQNDTGVDGDVQDAIEALQSARRLLALHHDVVDGPGDRPEPRPNWAMHATNAIDEAISHASVYVRSPQADAQVKHD